ncbi:MAG: YeeE/YedE family protein [Caldilinea sp. CFX5]|nr:YeeE/YedE family protein [Caldilinea sp. CFX5]
MEWLYQPWPWYVSGPLIGLSVPALLLLAGKTLGVSSSFRHLCSLTSPNSKLAYVRENPWRKELWNLIFVVGILLGGFVAVQFLGASGRYLPDHYYTWGGALLLFVGGLLVGFGARYADGCTSGHAIMGLANLKWPSLVATVSFFAGGLLMTALLGFF